ncbi:hypothetical protein ACFX19_035190 [Malus domestica]
MEINRKLGNKETQHKTRGSLHNGCLGEVSVVGGISAVGGATEGGEPEVDHLELHYAVQPQKTTANAVRTNLQTSDDQVKSDHQIHAAGQFSSSCLWHNCVQACAIVYFHA